MGRAADRRPLGFDGEVDGSDVTGTLSGGGGLDGLVLSLAGDVAVEGDDRAHLGPRASRSARTG